MKLPHSAIVRSPGLLPMYYKPWELAREISIPQRTLYDWLKEGAPHERDESNHIWINGHKFAEWVESNRKKKLSTQKLADDQAYCLKCKQAVSLLDNAIIPGKGRLFYIKGTCQKCSHTIMRGGSKNDRAL